jgi:hypothetical protein
LIERAERTGERERQRQRECVTETERECVTETERAERQTDRQTDRQRDQKEQGMWDKPVTLAGSKSSLSIVPKSVFDDAEGVGTSSGRR